MFNVLKAIYRFNAISIKMLMTLQRSRIKKNYKICIWTARRSSQSILKEINPEYSLEGVVLKLKLQYFDHVNQLLKKTLMLGKIESKRRGGLQKTTWLDGITDLMDMSLSKLWEMVKDREAWHVEVHWVAKSQTWLSDQTTTMKPDKTPKRWGNFEKEDLWHHALWF